MLVNRYTIVTLPAWIIVFAIGWEQIKNLKWKYILSIILVLSAVVNLVFFRQHYTRLRKDQFREASELVRANNKIHYPVYSTFSWHFNYYFRSEVKKVEDFYSADLSDVDRFWLLQAHDAEVEIDEIIEKQRETWDIAEKHNFYGSSAVLFLRKKVLSK